MKFLSRRFLYPILYTGLVLLTKKMGLDLSLTDLSLIAGTVGAFILGESYVDSKK